MKRSAFKPFMSKTKQEEIRSRKHSTRRMMSLSESSKGHPSGVHNMYQEKNQWCIGIDSEGKKDHVFENEAVEHLEFDREKRTHKWPLR